MIRRNKSIIGGLHIGERHWISVDQGSTYEILTFISNICRGKAIVIALTQTITFISTLAQIATEEFEIF